MPKKITFVLYLESEEASIYSFQIDDDALTELDKFFDAYSESADTYILGDFHRIVAAIEKILQNGVLDHYFRNEGKFKDNVCAVPLLVQSRDKRLHGTLRLYCIRLSERVLVIGGGGIKTTRTYDEDDVLRGHIELLQAIDKELYLKIRSGEITLQTNLEQITINI